ncbi:MAG: SpoIID/LytB domain-containing protein, partial [Clostridia bacterium]|nr:SpoIID/LytB domain-containing protein [Clostridia bacterium]
MKWHKRLLPAMVLCLLLLLPAAVAEQDTVRLLLTKVETTDQVTVSLDGSYSIGQTVFQRGTSIKIAALPEGIFAYYQGMAMFCGREAVLRRHALPDSAAGLENGIRVAGMYPLYPGDLHITAEGGQLRLILHIPLEEYLLGVVPYEMSDSWPLEALKAQAVAARTYALSRFRGAASDYDLVDNTNDQAFYGIQSENIRAKSAVEETSGIVGIDAKGKIANCYYSASNGGHTETLSNAWSMENVPYLVAKDDPYDLENPGSTVRSYSVSKDLSVSGPLERTLPGKAAEALAAAGTEAEILPESIRGITAMDIVSDGKALAVTLMVSVLQESEEEEVYFGVQSGAPQETAMVETLLPVRVVYDLFPGIEDLCGLDINRGLSNEIITVRETETAFVIESRRYGHGVGMSQ